MRTVAASLIVLSLTACESGPSWDWQDPLSLGGKSDGGSAFVDRPVTPVDLAAFTGKWTGLYVGPGGTSGEVSADLTFTGDTFTGTFTGRTGGQAVLRGKVFDGNRLVGEATLTGSGGAGGDAGKLEVEGVLLPRRVVLSLEGKRKGGVEAGVAVLDPSRR